MRERLALIVPPSGRPLDLWRAEGARRCAGGGLRGARASAGRTHRHLALNCARWTLSPVRHREGGHPRQHQPGLPGQRNSTLYAPQGRLPGAGARPRAQDSLYLDMLRELSPELDAAAPHEILSRRHIAASETVILIGTEAAPGCHAFADVMTLGGAAEAAPSCGLADVSVRRSDQHPVPAAPPGFPKGATLSHHNILNNGFFVGGAIRLQTRRALHSGAALSLLPAW